VARKRHSHSGPSPHTRPYIPLHSALQSLACHPPQSHDCQHQYTLMPVRPIPEKSPGTISLNIARWVQLQRETGKGAWKSRAAVEHPIARRASPSNVFAGNITSGFETSSGSGRAAYKRAVQFLYKISLLRSSRGFVAHAPWTCVNSLG